MTRASELRTLWVNTDRYTLSREGRSLVVQAPERSATRIPLARVGRAVIRGQGHSDGVLDACRALATAGAVVHFAQSGNDPALRLQTERAPANGPAAELAAMIHDRRGLAAFHWWADCQRRHAWSLVFRSGFRGDFAAARTRLRQYLARTGPDNYFPDELDTLEADLQQWLSAEIHRTGWEPVADALGARGVRLENVLHECLCLPLLWRFACWRRQQATAVPERERLRFFELDSVGRLAEQLHRHLRALACEYHARRSRDLATPELDDG